MVQEIIKAIIDNEAQWSIIKHQCKEEDDWALLKKLKQNNKDQSKPHNTSDSTPNKPNSSLKSKDHKCHNYG